MATALKDIQFNKPVLVGEANASNGTTYALGSHDVIGPIAQASFTPPGDSSAQTMWGFNGFATYAESANLANMANKASAIDFGSDSFHGLVATTVGNLPAIPFGSVTGSWATLETYLSDLNTALQNISGHSVAVVHFD